MKKIVFTVVLWFINLSLAFSLMAKTIRIHHRNDGVSQHNLNNHSRFYFQNGSVFSRMRLATSLEPDTVRILGLMVEFQPDENEKTTGDGKFDLSISSDPMIDPPPHNGQYFHHQLEALSNYYQSVSQGKLCVVGQVFRIVLTLPKEMGDYKSIPFIFLTAKTSKESKIEGVTVPVSRSHPHGPE